MSLIKVAYAIQPLAASSKVPLLGYGPYSAGLSNLPFYLRTTQSNKDQMLMMVSHYPFKNTLTVAANLSTVSKVAVKSLTNAAKASKLMSL